MAWHMMFVSWYVVYTQPPNMHAYLHTKTHSPLFLCLSLSHTHTCIHSSMHAYQTPKHQGGGVVHFINVKVPKRLEEGAEVEVGHLAGHKELVPADGTAVAFRYNRLCVMEVSHHRVQVRSPTSPNTHIQQYPQCT